MNVLDGTVIGRNMQRHRHHEYFRIRMPLNGKPPPARPSTPSSTTTSPTSIPPTAVDRAASPMDLPLHPDSWLNAVEAFFATLAKGRVKPGAFRSVVDLQVAINRFLDDHNRQSRPFT
jgi:hypothetical protein